MDENRAWGAVSLEQLTLEDQERQARRAALVANVKRRRGNKGSRVWGFATPGTGKRRSRRA
jgi:hypothetical protein